MDSNLSMTRRPPYELGLLVLLVGGIYFSRIADPPLVGEEPRWACGAEEMLRTGDWIVPRQQGQVFPERPPLGSWVMALAALARGTDVDVVAIRLPSLIAVLLTSLVIYAYARNFLSRWGAFAAGAVYATFGIVLQIGRQGESEALFTLFVGGSLLVWHLGYSRGWPSLVTWSAGYTLAALGALVKGPQAPVYFMAVTGTFLMLRRDWSWLLSWRHAVGIGVFAAIVGAWQVPFYLATDWPTVQAVWGGLAKDRFITAGLIQHVATYPIEIVVGLLPWSPLLLAFASRKFRSSLGQARPMVLFLVLAIGVTAPSVLFAALARGRYFMPLFPCFAVLIGLVLDRVANHELPLLPLRAWRAFLHTWGVTGLCGAIAGVVATFTSVAALDELEQPPWFAVTLTLFAFLAAGTLVWCGWRNAAERLPASIVTLMLLAGLFRVGFISNIETSRNSPVEKRVMAVRESLPEPDKLISFGPVDHRFVYFYRLPIKELEWPIERGQIPSDVKYFCFFRHPEDSDETRAIGRGRTWRRVPKHLPLEWESVAEIRVDRRDYPGPHCVVVIGRVLDQVDSPSDTTGPRPSGTPTARAEGTTTRRRSS